MSQKMPAAGSLLALFSGYEELHTWEDHESGMMGIIAIHNTNLGRRSAVVGGLCILRFAMRSSM